MDAIFKKFLSMLPDFLSGIMSWIYSWFTGQLTGLYTWMLSYVTQPFRNFWNDPIIQGAIHFSQWVAYAVMGISVLFMIIDYAEDIAAKSSLSISEMVMNIIKGFVFCLIAPQLSIMAITLGAQLAETLDLTTLSNGLNSNPNVDFSGARNLLWILVCIIAFVIFFFITARQYGMMLIQIMTYSLYVPGVVRGDTQSMGAWMRQTVAITVTYLCQYFLFYLGLSYTSSSSLIWATVCWTGMASTAKVLNKFGLSAGFGGGTQALSLAGQALRIAT